MTREAVERAGIFPGRRGVSKAVAGPPAAQMPATARGGVVTPLSIMALQRRAGNQATLHMLHAQVLSLAAGGRPRQERIQRVVSTCSDWWNAKLNANGAAISNRDLGEYWKSIAADRLKLLPKTDRFLMGIANPSEGKDRLDAFARFLNHCEQLWIDTAADRKTLGLETSSVDDVIRSVKSQDAQDDFTELRAELTELIATWAETAGEIRKSDNLSNALSKTCTRDFLDQHVIGYPNAVIGPAAVAAASQLARTRSTSESTVLNLSDPTNLAAFQKEVVDKLNHNSKILHTVRPYPLIHIEKNTGELYVGQASVEITCDKSGGFSKLFNHFNGYVWAAPSPVPTKWP